MAHGPYTLLESKLGVAGIHSDGDLVSLVEKRLPSSAVKALVRGGLTDAEAWHLIVPRRTLAHRIARQEPLSRDESDKAVRVARIDRGRFLCGEAPQAVIRDDTILVGGFRIGGVFFRQRPTKGHVCAAIKAGTPGIAIRG